MRLFRRSPLAGRPVSRRSVPTLEALEDRMLPSADPLFGQFQSALGLLTLHGDSASHLVSASLSSAGYVELRVANQTASSDPSAANYDPALAGASGQTLKAIQLDGDAGLDHLIVGNLNVAGGLSVQSDGILDVQGQVSAAGPIQLDGQTVLLSGQVRADGAIGGSITVSAGSVLQSGLLEADGNQGDGGAIQVDFTAHYVATVSALTAANSTGTGGGGLIVIDGSGAGTLFSSGNYQANAVHGGSGGDIDLFAKQVQLIGANIDASGGQGGGWVRVGGDSPSDIAAHGGSTAGVSYADTTKVDATTTLSADALSAGNGGRIVVWSQQSTTFGGTLSAQGAGPQGTGGLLEVSSAGQLTYGGQANATARSGKQGRLLLDPQNLIISSGVGLPQFNLVNPETDGLDNFGSSIVVLSNGNVVVADFSSDVAAANAGAVYLYNGLTGALLATLTGSTSGDEVGSGGITALSNGNFVVSSPSWQDGGNSVGAATWVSGTASGVAVVSEANSLFGSTSGDEVGFTVTALRTNGNYVVASPSWHNAGAMVGAVTWGDGTHGTVGAVDATNSLVGSTAGDDVGSDGVTALTNGNYVVASPNWQNPNGSGGAATWGNGLGGTVGPVSAANSLVGGFSYSGDVGSSVTALSDGNYVVSSPGWNPDNQFADAAMGAATWGDGSNGTIGVVSASNSLLGATGFDNVSVGGIKALTNGNYAVISPEWQDSVGDYVGAVTWCQAGGGTVGAVTSGNSLVGSTNGDQLGSGGVTLLSDGNYVVNSPDWQNDGTVVSAAVGAVVGAVTWSDANGTTVGPITASNSLLGSTDGDQIGSGGVIALTNGNYVIDSPNWQNGVGAVTFGQAGGSTVGSIISNSNSLVGTAGGDQVGSGGVTLLSNGNYVVSSPSWQNIGAVTLSQANGSTVGAVTGTNSLIGSTSGDQVGSGGVTALSNGDYLVSSPDWQQAHAQVGAATWSDGTTGFTIDHANTIDTGNSIVGAGAPALLSQVLGLQGGNAFLASFTGNGGAITVLQLAATIEAFGTAPSSTLTISPSFITATLDTGTAVVLQASNDLTVSSPILVNNPTGNGGALTLQAGRQIVITANITTDNGNLTLIANDVAADGVVNSERLGGVSSTAAITMTAGTTIDAGTGDVLMNLESGAGNTNYASDDITAGDIIAHNVTLINAGLGDGSLHGVSVGGGADMASVTASGNLIVNSTFDISDYGALSQPGANVIHVAGTTTLTAAGAPGGEILLDNSADQFGGPVTFNDPGQDIVIEASGNLTLSSSTTSASLTVSASGILTSTGPLATSGVEVQDQGGTINSGASSLTGGTISLTNAQNDFQGLVTLSSPGAITLVNSSALSIGSPTISGGDVTLTGPTTLTAPSISFIGDLNVGAQTLTLNTTTAVALNSDTTLAGGTISDSSGLDVGNGANLSGTGVLQVGTGSAGVLIKAGSKLSPGLSPTGLTINGDLTFTTTSILSEEFQSATQFGDLIVNGAIDLGNATLQGAFVSPYVPAAYTQFQVLTNGPENPITGKFVNGTSLPVGANTFGIAYVAGAGNDLVLTVQGPPAGVNALPAYSLTSFNVSWIGQEYAQGASAFNVYVSDNGGPFTLWQSDTTQTSATYVGQRGHTYSFGSVYTDDADNQAPVSQASTTVQMITTITWNNPGNITYGTALSATQLNATATAIVGGSPVTVPGTFTYAPASGAILGGGNNQTLSVLFTPTNTIAYTTVTANAAINVLPATQSIVFNVNSPVSYSDPMILSATGGGSLNPVTFQVISGPGVVNGSTLDFTGIGSVVVEADQAGNANYAAAAPVQQTILAITAYTTPSAENENGAAKSITVSSLLAGHFGDADGAANTKQGIAIFQTSGNGTWQYSTTGATWIAIGSVSQAQALLLPAADFVRFMPTTNFSGLANLDFVAWDGTQGKAGATANVSVGGGATPFSAAAGSLALTVNPVPRWVGTGAALTSLSPGTYLTTNPSTPAGNTITSVFGAYFHDDNLAVPVGVAINSVTGLTSGTWQYSTNGGTIWNKFPPVSATAVLLLSASDEIRFVPNVNFAGTVSLNALAWDGSVGTHGAPAVNPATLASSSLSTAPLTATMSANRAPTLSVLSFTQGTVAQYANGATATVASLLVKAGYADLDGAAVARGMAITGAAANFGSYQYMLSGGTWQTLPIVSPSSALLLPSTASLRYVGGSQLGTGATLTFEGWDQTQGVAGQTFNIASPGGASAFSTASATLSYTVTASTNHAPTLSHSAFSEPAVTVNTTGSAIAVTTLLTQAGYADQNGSTLSRGIAVTSTAGAGGVLQYMLAGGTWQAVPNVSSSSALLLPSTASLRLVAGSQVGTTATLMFDGWDQTQGTAGQLFNIANVSGASAFSATSATVSIPVGQAPSWSAATGAALTALLPGAYSVSNTPGNTIASVFGAFFVDANVGRTVGVAVSAVSGNGTWQYSITGGASWVTFATTLSKTSAMLLSGTDLIRFVPRITTAVTGTLTAYAWDGSVSSHGNPANLTSLGTGGASAFSATTLAASSPYNTAPTLTKPTVTLLPVNENANSAPLTVTSLLSSAGYTDLDGKTLPSGIAVTGDIGTAAGTWQWLSGATWTALPSVSSSSAFLLPSTASLRFMPANNMATNTPTSAALTYLGWDETAGLADKSFALPVLGGASAFSTASTIASMSINFVKQAPNWVSGATANFTPVVGFSTISNPIPSPLGDTVGAVFGAAFHDAAGASVGIAISAQAGTSFGGWQYSTNNGSNWISFPTTLSATSALLLSANDLIRFVPTKTFVGTVSLTAYAWDGTGTFTTVNGNLIANVTRTGTGGADPFSATLLTANCFVNSAPTLQ